MIYVQDNDRTYRRTSYESGDRVSDVPWTCVVQAHVRSDRVSLCPSDPRLRPRMTNGATQCIEVTLFPYATNHSVIPAHDRRPPAMSGLDAPAGTMMLSERRPLLKSGLPAS